MLTRESLGEKSLVARLKKDTVISVGNTTIGGGDMTIIAGPCAVETKEQMLCAALIVEGAGGTILRGGAFKPRTSPYSFQGLGEEGLALLKEAGLSVGLPTISEVMESCDVPLVSKYVDIMQVGSRNMSNFPLLKSLGRINKPIMLKRGLSATIQEWLLAAEYIMSEGNSQVILCERGIRTFETAFRNTLDITGVIAIKELTHLPIIVDPSHASGVSHYVAPLAKAALGVGVDGLMIEMHPNPATALCDGEQSLSPAQFRKLMVDIQCMNSALGKKVVYS